MTALSPRELEVARLLAAGLSHKEAAARLGTEDRPLLLQVIVLRSRMTKAQRMDSIKAAEFLLSMVGAYGPLTGRQFRVLQRMVASWRIEAIARDLGMSRAEAEVTATAAMGRLGVASPEEAAEAFPALMYQLPRDQFDEPRTISASLRFRVLERDGFACRYCGRRPPEVRLEVDHIVPWSRGGRTAEENLGASCSDCNGGKSNAMPAGAAR